MIPGSRSPLLTIAIILVVLILQQKTPLFPPGALALRGLNNSSQVQNRSLPGQSNATTYLPDPSKCDPPDTAHMGTFFSASSSEGQLDHGAHDAVQQPSVALNVSEAQNSTHSPLGNLNANVSDCGNVSGSAEHKSPQEQNQAGSMEFYLLNHADEGTAAHVDDEADVATTIRSLIAEDSVKALEVDKGDVIVMDAERLGGSTSPPSSSSIHTAAGGSVVREAMYAMDLDKAPGVFGINERERLADATPPPSDTSIHTAAQSSVARESVQVMEIAEEIVVAVSSEQLRRATPPPIDTSIHTASQRSAARESTQVVVEMNEDGVSNEEQLGVSTPQPGDSDIHTASQSSTAATDSNVRLRFQHIDEGRHFHTLRR